MAIKPSEVSGDVFVIGHGQAFPERCLFFLPEGGFREKLRPEVKSLVTTEPEFLSNPESIIFGLETESRDVDPIPEVPKQNPLIIDYYDVGAGYLLDKWPVSVQFDTVTMFRLPNMERQLREQDLLDCLAKHVRPGGRFICSGSFDTERPPADLHWRVERTAVMSIYTDGYPFVGVNLGVVYQRLAKPASSTR